MFRVNPLPRKTIITTDEVIAMGPLGQNPDPTTLLNAIIIAEERFLKPAMCPDFYYAFRDAKNTVVTDVNKDFLEGLVNDGNTGEAIVLSVGDVVNAIEFVDTEKWVEWWNEFGWKIAAEAVVYVATPTNWSRYNASGEMQNNPKTITMGGGGDGGGSVSVELKDIKWKLDKILMDRIDPMIDASHQWLCENKSDFPLYNCRKSASDGGNPGNRKTGWIHDVYESRDSYRRDSNCCND